jgi:hypothetical protein
MNRRKHSGNGIRGSDAKLHAPLDFLALSIHELDHLTPTAYAATIAKQNTSLVRTRQLWLFPNGYDCCERENVILAFCFCTFVFAKQ